jgi:hypothetical protein
MDVKKPPSGGLERRWIVDFLPEEILPGTALYSWMLFFSGMGIGYALLWLEILVTFVVKRIKQSRDAQSAEENSQVTPG